MDLVEAALAAPEIQYLELFRASPQAPNKSQMVLSIALEWVIKALVGLRGLLPT